MIDDEKYFTLSHTTNDRYFTSPTKSRNSINVSHKFKVKFEKKVLVWVAISKHGISKPYFSRGGLAIDRFAYRDQCIVKRLIPFIRQYHADDNYLFWPDKASSHYAGTVLQLLKDQKINFVVKCRNPTNVPQCRPIEDFWSILCNKVYKNGWSANNLDQLENRIKSCLRKIDRKTVQNLSNSVNKRLRLAGRKGPIAVVH